MIKIFQYSEEFQVKSVFQGKRKVAQKSLIDKKYIVNTVKKFQRKVCFSGQVQVVQIC